jgi:hypothetical protein
MAVVFSGSAYPVRSEPASEPSTLTPLLKVAYNDRLHEFRLLDGTGIRLDGVTRVIRTYLCGASSTFTRNKLIRQTKRKRHLAGCTLTGSTAFGVGDMVERKSKGRRQGNVVDDGLTRMTNMCVTTEDPGSRPHPHTRRKRARYTYSQLVVERFVRIFNTRGYHNISRELHMFHPLSSLVFAHLLQLGLRPLQAQVPVADPLLRLATAVDQIWFDGTTGQIVVIELKVTDTDGYHSAGSNMLRPLQTVVNSCHNQYQLQLLLTDHMFRRTFGLDNTMALLVRVTTSGIHTTTLDEWCIEYKSAILEKLQHRRRQVIRGPPQTIPTASNNSGM